MKRFDDMNPIAVAVYYLCVIAVTMFSMQPLMLSLSLLISVITCIQNRSVGVRGHIFSVVLFVIAAVMNPIFVHNGATPLFYFNDNPITLEAVIYGVSAAGMTVAALYWLRSLSASLSSDKVMYIFGRFSPKLALIISMAIRYVGLFKLRWNRIQSAQKALGLYDDGNLIDGLRGRARVLSILITWTLENGIVTAESMESRGWGSGRRTSYAPYRVHMSDISFIALCAALTAVTVVGLNHTGAVYYPKMDFDLFTPWGIAGAAAFALLCMLPIIINTKEAVKWSLLRSKA